MLAEAMKFLTELAAKAQAPVQVAIPDWRAIWYAAGGQHSSIPLPVQPRDHNPATLDDLIALATRFVGDSDGPLHVGDLDEPSTPVVWYGEDAVVLVIDDAGYRVETATLHMQYSDAFARLMSLRAERTWFEPKPFVRLLRVDLAGTLAPGELLERVRSIRFEAGSVTTTESARTRESLGREIRSKVDAAGEIPEEVTLSVPVFKNPGETDRYPCRCAVEVDPAMGRLQLLPLPDEIERTARLAVTSIGGRLRAGLPESVPCYRGTP